MDRWLPANQQLCEIRLLSILPAHRKTSLFTELLLFAADVCLRQGYTLAVISGTLRQARLYRHIGFTPFFEPVGTQDALYQPMYLTLASAHSLLGRLHGTPKSVAPVSFLSGPVEISEEVARAFSAPAISHRSLAYQSLLRATQKKLCQLTKAGWVQILIGSGTLANDVVAAQLQRLQQTGLVLANGEFGERLVDHAQRMGLDCSVMAQSWCVPFDIQEIEQWLREHPETGWLWCAHCETSTGMLNDLPSLLALCKRYNVKLCLDCISALGVIDVDLSGIFLASGVSSKGLASVAGIGLVFYNTPVQSDPALPRYLDLGYYQEKEGVPFTQPSNLLAALHQSLRNIDLVQRQADIARKRTRLLGVLAEYGLINLVDEKYAAPAIITFRLLGSLSAHQLGQSMENEGLLLNYNSRYLQERNMLQICLMGSLSDESCQRLVNSLIRLVVSISPSVATNPQF